MRKSLIILGAAIAITSLGCFAFDQAQAGSAVSASKYSHPSHAATITEFSSSSAKHTVAHR